ncbi:short-chain dehydrogenase [Brevundimonas sp. LM2]|uniref:SDR family NAD(P)-dependent oxidoreductase n=1 Tax=Brevundimonas sp. LM2 TaxID=1938605 RepID=UPI000983F198|nr:SDR family NAD(P)-dependent oxidoreductase [Brevundimonas sp. LM2]AQR61886.1 short-chain dehydrogenase [Brevundimonas sp. LM2]
MTFSSNQQPASTAHSTSRRQLLRLGAAGAAASLAAGCALPGAAQPADRESQAWAAANIPDQTGRRVLITGGNGYPREGRSGLGYQAALALVRKGADVTIASRDATKGAAALRLIRGEVPGARIRFDALDLTDLSQVKAYAMRWRGSGERLDLLINNAGVMGRRARETTRSGHERVFATNVMGPFVLTAGLMPILRAGRAPRVAWVASGRIGPLALDDLQFEQDYDYAQAYDRSKLGVLLVAQELQRRSQAAGWGVASMACHPGVARTFLVPDGPGMESAEGLRQRALPILFGPAARGALSLLYAGASSSARGGRYYGPAGLVAGSPEDVDVPPLARNETEANRLWDALQSLGDTDFS